MGMTDCNRRWAVLGLIACRAKIPREDMAKLMDLC